MRVGFSILCPSVTTKTKSFFLLCHYFARGKGLCNDLSRENDALSVFRISQMLHQAQIVEVPSYSGFALPTYKASN
jgi:hypothetical protein